MLTRCMSPSYTVCDYHPSTAWRSRTSAIRQQANRQPAALCAGVFLQSKAIIGSPLLPLLFAAAYAVLAWQAWQGGSLTLVQDVLHAAKPWPDASLLAAMFQDRALAALAWLHLLMLDFLTARCGSSKRG